MIVNFFFAVYIAIIGCAIPISASFNLQQMKSKYRWAEAVYILISIQDEYYCHDGNEEECVLMGRRVGTGTSFVIENNYEENYSIMMTAAHLCATQREYWDLIIPTERNNVIHDYTLKVVVNSIEEEMYDAEILRYDYDADTCVMKVPHVFRTHLEIAREREAPDYGEEIWTIGAPTGYFPDSAKPINSGYFAGEVIRWREEENGDMTPIPFYNFSLATIQGMSGSPIINRDGKVVGIVSAVAVNWHMINYSPTIQQIREIAEKD